ncbi:MAG: ammonia-forming cytochrome c nitrite reductase subunit c552 [Thermoanaerobaculia bacterium]|nr:ammonia-forming cytochrome c nitrite reductase subunit c552 [Thermoanaerobaculia bacterium]
MTEQKSSTARTILVIAAIAAFAAVGVTVLLVNIMEHKQEARNPFFRVVELDDDTEDPAVWGKNFPIQYDTYKRTVDMVRTKFGGSEAFPRTPTENDPRSLVTTQKLDADPRLKRMWEGYHFSADFREERGHAYMLDDQTFTLRQEHTKQPGACMNCHASTYVTMKKLGNGDLVKGFEAINQMPYFDVRKHVKHPVACIDCHDSKTMALRVTRPAFIESLRALKEHEGVSGYDVNTMATRQEMRTYVCGQCHVEYYFKGPEKRLVYPWSRGQRADEILAYYDEVGQTDWTHAETGSSNLKAQHPEFETFSQGIHGRSGVACADCHMPYTKVGAMKVSDHHVRSPLLNINKACQTCHRWSEEELKGRAERIQARHTEMRDLAMDALVALIDDLKAAKEAGRSDEELKEARNFQRRASFFVDFAEAENSVGFHAPQEGARILAMSIDASRKGQLAVRGALPATPQPLQKAAAPAAPKAPEKVAVLSTR